MNELRLAMRRLRLGLCLGGPLHRLRRSGDGDGTDNSDADGRDERNPLHSHTKFASATAARDDVPLDKIR